MNSNNYTIYDFKGIFVDTFDLQKDVCNFFNICESIVTRSIQQGYLLAGGHTLIVHPKGEEQPKKIKVSKKYPKFRNPKTGRFSRFYLAYDLLGNLKTKTPLTISDMTEFTGASKDTVLDAIRINNTCKGHIIKICYDLDRIPRKLSPLAPEFRVYQYDRVGNFVQSYTRISTASRETRIPYDDIRNNIQKGFTFRSDYFFTGHIGSDSMKKINPNFRVSDKPKKIHVWLSNEEHPKQLLTVNKASKVIGCVYQTLAKRLKKEDRFIFRGYLIEVKLNYG